MEPIKAPRMMTIPMELKVPEKPAPMTDAIPDLVTPSTVVVLPSEPLPGGWNYLENQLV